MNKKNGSIKLTTGIFIIILAFLVVGGLWMSTKQEASPVEEVEDEVLNLLENLKQETGIDFSAIADVEFDWMVEKDKKMERVTIQGKGFEANEILSEQYTNVESFLKDNGFEADIYNAAAGTISGLDGYRKDYLVCVVIGGAAGYKEAAGQWIPPETDKNDIEVKCGQGDSSIDPIISKEETIATKKDGNFFIRLEANPTTGYQWEVDFDSDYLELTNREYVAPSSEVVGAGGDETFNFLALKTGQTEITFSYLRSWEKDIPPIEERVYQITIE